jgi:hypothetical protein
MGNVKNIDYEENKNCMMHFSTTHIPILKLPPQYNRNTR